MDMMSIAVAKSMVNNTVEEIKEKFGAPLVSSTSAGMTDQSRVYVYTGNESGFLSGHWYYYNGSMWTDGGVYNAVAVETDTTLSVSGKAADGKAVGDQLSDVMSDLNQKADKSILVGYDKEETPVYVADLNFVTNGTAYIFNSAYDTYYVAVKQDEKCVYTIKNGTGSAYYRFGFAESIPAHNVAATYLDNNNLPAAAGETITYEYIAESDGYLSVSCYENSVNTISANVSVSGINTEIAEIQQVLESANLSELPEIIDDQDARLTAIENEIINESVNKYDPSLQTLETISPHYWVNGAPYSSTQFDGSYNCTALIPVKPNTTYTVGLVGANPVDPWNTAGQRGWSFDSDGNFISGSGWSSNTFTTPSNAAYIRFNYYKSGGMVSLERLNSYCMLVEGTALPESYSPYYSNTIKDVVATKASYPIRVIVDEAGTSVFAISKYNTQYDQMVKVGIGGGNGLVDFRGFYTINNPTDELSQNGSNAVAYLETSGDWHAPFIVAASQNADGDQPSNRYFTGGNHQYNNTGSGSTPTARVANIKFLLDNRELSSGDNKCGNVLEIRWNNYVQAYNTTKADGSGREVLKEEHSLVYDGRTWESYVSLIPLENISIGTWYGFQLMGLNTVFQNIRYIGATNRGLYNYATASNCGDSTTNEMQCYGATHKEILRIDPTYDLGDFTHIGTNKSLFSEIYGKAYAYLIASTTMEEGSIWSAHATYKFIPVS